MRLPGPQHQGLTRAARDAPISITQRPPLRLGINGRPLGYVIMARVRDRVLPKSWCSSRACATRPSVLKLAVTATISPAACSTDIEAAVHALTGKPRWMNLQNLMQGSRERRGKHVWKSWYAGIDKGKSQRSMPNLDNSVFEVRLCRWPKPLASNAFAQW